MKKLVYIVTLCTVLSVSQPAYGLWGWSSVKSFFSGVTGWFSLSSKSYTNKASVSKKSNNKKAPKNKQSVFEKKGIRKYFTLSYIWGCFGWATRKDLNERAAQAEESINCRLQETSTERTAWSEGNRQRRDTIQNKVEHNQSLIDRNAEKIKALTQSLEDAQKQFSSQIKESKDEISKHAQSAFIALQKQLNEFEKKVQKNKDTQRVIHNKNMAALAIQLKAWDDSFKNFTAQIDAADGNMQALEQSLASFAQSVGTIQSKVEEVAKSNQDNACQVVLLSKDMQSQKRGLAKTQEKVQSLIVTHNQVTAHLKGAYENSLKAQIVLNRRLQRLQKSRGGNSNNKSIMKKK